MHWDVIEVQVEAPLSLLVRFMDGTEGEVRFEISFFTGVFQVLKDRSIFEQAHVDSGAVSWPGELALAPDAMYNAIKKQGELILR